MVGLVTGKALAVARGKPLIAVNHLEGHALTPRLADDVAFPYLLLLVSGGHCQLLLVEGVGHYRRLAHHRSTTRLGEAFDKTRQDAGPRLSRRPGGGAAARSGNAGPFACRGRCWAARSRISPSPGSRRRYCAAVLELASESADLSGQDRADLAAALASRHRRLPGRPHAQRHRADLRAPSASQRAGRRRWRRRQYRDPRRARNRSARETGLRFVAPPLSLCTDNAAMIAWAGVERLERMGLTDALDFAPRPRWPLDPAAPKPCAARGEGVSGRVAAHRRHRRRRLGHRAGAVARRATASRSLLWAREPEVVAEINDRRTQQARSCRVSRSHAAIRATGDLAELRRGRCHLLA